ncbi:S-adenosyl-L-methionine-dependent methyltransferase [Pilatotrama ljubarskyi]|nr:S-adenosyl-L-methionine-dependent methyltransferase [Pilatotrama ljubarskyi]
MAISVHHDLQSPSEDLDIVPIPDDEIPTFFRERGDRLFAAHAASTYPLPVDGTEQERQDELHSLLRALTETSCANYIQEALRQGAELRVVDLGTGTGSWVLDMARLFPSVSFYGVDIAPIATRFPPPNVTFEVHDLQVTSRYTRGSFDIVHARLVCIAMPAYHQVVEEAARILRSGGLFSACEWSRSIAMADGTDVTRKAPRACAFLEVLWDILGRPTDISASPSQVVADAILQCPDFDRVVTTVAHYPVGQWHPDIFCRLTGARVSDVLGSYALALKPFLQSLLPGAIVRELVDGFIADISTVGGLVTAYTAFHAQRI